VKSTDALPAVDLSQVERDLRNWLSGARKVVIVGIGSQWRGDDAVGARVAQELHGKTSSNVLPIVCWTVPESCTGPVRLFAPTHILLIDAAELGRTPGSCQLIPVEDVLGLSLSTHTMPLKLLAKYLSMATGAPIALLAVQPKQTGFGEAFSEELQKAAHRLAGVLLRVLPGGESKNS
jgi:hydrogenase 3 maturation protease